MAEQAGNEGIEAQRREADSLELLWYVWHPPYPSGRRTGEVMLEAEELVLHYVALSHPVCLNLPRGTTGDGLHYTSFIPLSRSASVKCRGNWGP